jgi:acetyl esterase/lipase
MKEQMNGVLEFLKAKENQEFDFQALYQKMMKENEFFFKRKGEKTVDDLNAGIGEAEKIFLAKAFRSGFEYAANMDQKRYPIPEDVTLEQTDAGGVSAEWQMVPDARKSRVLFYIHGGGFIMGSAKGFRAFTVRLGQLTKMRVLSLNYRLVPENPYPAQLEDCAVAYKWLLSMGIEAKNIVIAGDSAGGNLTLATLVRSRNNKIPLPAGGICLSPATDLSVHSSDDSFWENAATDPVLADIGLSWWIRAYLGDANPSDPLVSPVHADLKGLPPLLVQASTCEMLFSDSKRLVDQARSAGVNATLQTWNCMMHAFQYFGLHDLSETREALDNIAKFVRGLFN